ncbi:MAG: hypothetical protein IJB99_04320, partial [Clostridia bacterium]|nr:hypothetical protein [Clostridia bacterium]
MKRLLNRLNRMMMLFLALIPVLSAIFPLLLNSIWTGSAWFFCQTACAALIALIPAYVGSYREYDVITYEGSRTNDPNPDREATHTLVKEGKRFPLRIFAALGFLAIELILLFLIPSEWFKDGTLVKRLAFLAIMLLIEIYALRDFPSIHFIWDDIPGVFIGVICYLAISIYLAFTKADVSDMKKLVSVAAVLYLFFASVTLNRQSITQSMSAHQGETRKPPKQILIKNRTIVLSFASLVTIVSVIEPVRKGVIWLLRKVRDFAGWIRSLFGGGESETVSELPFDMMPAQPEFVEAAEEAYEHSLFSDIIVYGFLLIVAIGFLWMLWDKIRALVDKLTKWLEKFAGNIQEGFYDEKEEL